MLQAVVDPKGSLLTKPGSEQSCKDGWAERRLGPGLEKVKDTKCSLGCRKHQELSKGAQLSARLLPGATAAWEWLNITAPSKDLWEDNLSIFIPALSEHFSTPAALGCSPELPHPVSLPEKARVIQVVGGCLYFRTPWLPWDWEMALGDPRLQKEPFT